MSIEIAEDAAVFLKDGGDPVGAVRHVRAAGRDEVIIFVENAGEFRVPLSAVHEVHFGKVMLDPKRLDSAVLRAMGHAHDAETPE